MRMLVFLACLLLLPGPPLYAGAWPREKGKAFIALSQNVSHYGNGLPDGYQSLYGEYGVTSRLTFGAKLWQRADRRHGDILAFVRYPLSPPEQAHKFAVGLALGARLYANGDVLPVVQPEFAWGKGFETPLGHGWMSLETSVGQAIGGDDRWYKADFTLGLKPDDKTHLILQMRSHRKPEGDVAIFAPSYVRKIVGDTHLEIGVTYRFRGTRRVGATIGTWIEF